mmetsp:Transcript_57649/g.160661  ORF Transcript_57649/g.160661 Transcript_57649/m.160661 type:complete len:375 (-) Transcript_57649:1205-2329(-)
MHLRVDDQVISRLHERGKHARCRRDAGGVHDGVLGVEELCDTFFQFQVQLRRTVESPGATRPETVHLHSVPDSLLRCGQRPRPVAEGIEHSHVTGAALLWPFCSCLSSTREVAQLRKKLWRNGGRQGLGRPIGSLKGNVSSVHALHRRCAEPHGVVFALLQCLASARSEADEFLQRSTVPTAFVQHAHLPSNRRDRGGRGFELLARMRRGHAETCSALEHWHSGEAHHDDGDARRQATPRELGELERMVNHHRNDGRVDVTQHRKTLVDQPLAKEIAVAPDRREFVGADRRTDNPVDDTERHEGLRRTWCRHGGGEHASRCTLPQRSDHIVRRRDVATSAPERFRESTHHNFHLRGGNAEKLSDATACGADCTD